MPGRGECYWYQVSRPKAPKLSVGPDLSPRSQSPGPDPNRGSTWVSKGYQREAPRPCVLTQAQVTERAELDDKTITGVENAQGVPDLDRIFAPADALDVPAAELFE